MKLVFLDIDGVMNSITGSVLYMADMEVSKIELLKKLINLSGAEGIVLTSDRRFSKPYMDQFIEVMDKFEIFLEGTLRYPKEYEEDPDDNRGKQIVDYLESSKNDIESIVILDNEDDGISDLFPDEFLKVDRKDGLTEDIMRHAIEILRQ